MGLKRNTILMCFRTGHHPEIKIKQGVTYACRKGIIYDFTNLTQYEGTIIITTEVNRFAKIRHS